MDLREIYPLLVLGGMIGLLSIIFVVAYATIKNKKEAIGFDRHMKDSEIIVRLLRYAKPYLPQFLLVGLIMTVSISYDIIAPIIMGEIIEMVQQKFEMSELLSFIIIYGRLNK